MEHKYDLAPKNSTEVSSTEVARGNTDTLAETPEKKEDKKFQSRNWCFTSFEKSEPVWDLGKATKYLIFGKEICPETKRQHWQGYVEFNNAKTISATQKALAIGKAHVESRRGTPLEAANYCKKDGDFKEFGQISNQGERKDLKVVRDEIKAGKSVDEIVMEDPMLFHQYGRTLERIETIRFNSNCQRRAPIPIYLQNQWIRTPNKEWRHTYDWKSLRAERKEFEEFKDEDFYFWDLESKFQCKYKQQKVCILNEYRGTIEDLKQRLLGSLPCYVQRKNLQPILFTSLYLVEIWNKGNF